MKFQHVLISKKPLRLTLICGVGGDGGVGGVGGVGGMCVCGDVACGVGGAGAGVGWLCWCHQWRSQGARGPWPTQTFGECFFPINLRCYVILVCKWSLDGANLIVP